MNSAIRVDLRHPTGIIAARERARLLAEELGYGEIGSVHIAVAVSELCRATRSRDGSWFEIDLSNTRDRGDSADQPTGAVLRWGPRVAEKTATGWAAVFDGVRQIRNHGSDSAGVLEAVLRPTNRRRLSLDEDLAANLIARVDRELVPSRAELEAARAAAEESTRLKAQFLANMSHEIRTPLNGILGMAQLLSETELTEQQVEYVRALRRSGEVLLVLINDILDFSKIEAGRMELEPIEFRLRDSLAEMLEPLAAQAFAKGLELIQEVGTDVPDLVFADSLRLQQVLLNLVGNAVKFTDHGHIVIGVERVEREDPDPAADPSKTVTLHFTVRDTGPGVSPEAQTRIFEAFGQADASTTRRFGGTGLGLSISSRLVELMGGRIWLESELGAGTTFHFEIKVGVDGGSDTQQPDAPELAGGRAVVASPSPIVRRVVEQNLRVWQIEAQGAESKAAAIEAFEDWARRGHSSVLIVDAGIEGAAELEERAQALTAVVPSTRVIGLAYPSQLEDIRRYRSRGIGWVLKPVRQSALYRALTTDPARPGRQPAGGDGPAASSSPLNLLVAEDNQINQMVVKAMLESEGHQVTLACDGQEALDLLERETFDAVLMDVQMPRISGTEATMKLRQREAATGRRRTPVIALTAHAMSSAVSECTAAGMDDYLTKPIIKDSLVTALSRIEPRAASTESVERSSDTGNSRDIPQPQQPDAEPPVFDRDQALARLGGDHEVLKDIVATLLDEIPRWSDRLEAEIAAGDRASVAQTAHMIKGALANLSAHAARQAAADLEEAAKDAEGPDVGRVFSRLRAELDRATTALRPMVD